MGHSHKTVSLRYFSFSYVNWCTNFGLLLLFRVYTTVAVFRDDFRMVENWEESWGFFQGVCFFSTSEVFRSMSLAYWGLQKNILGHHFLLIELPNEDLLEFDYRSNMYIYIYIYIILNIIAIFFSKDALKYFPLWRALQIHLTWGGGTRTRTCHIVSTCQAQTSLALFELNIQKWPAVMIGDLPSRSLRSASERRLVVPSQRGSKSLSRTFSFTVPGRWNDLPTPIRNAESLPIFKQQLKTHLFQLYLTI